MSFREDAQTWEWKYGELLQTQNVLVHVGGAEHQPPQHSDTFNAIELSGKPQLPPQLEG